MRYLRSLTILLAIIIFIQGCTSSEVTKDDCIKDGKKYKITKVLNLRTGKYQAKTICLN
ncbi:MAG: hypothetical protein ACQERD_03800 [Campylobacterota bacterium]